MQKLDRIADLKQNPRQLPLSLPKIFAINRQVQRSQRDTNNSPHVRLVLFQNQQSDELQALCIIILLLIATLLL